jgi:transmembrane sensor
MSTNDPISGQPELEAIRDQAAQWVVREDRGLSPVEQRAFQSWLKADPRHATAYGQSTASWRHFQSLSAALRNPAQEPQPLLSRWPVLAGLAAAALICALIIYQRSTPAFETSPLASNLSAPLPITRRLADGSIARLKADAEIEEIYTPQERRVRLVRGEAFFTVEKDKVRPFYVEAGNTTVRAVGTAFSVRLQTHEVNILVTEGTVQVTPPPPTVGAEMHMAATPARVEAGHRAIVASSPREKVPEVLVSPVTTAEIVNSLAWNVPMLELAGSTLGDLATAFTQQSGQKIEITDPLLRAVRIGGRFPHQDVEGFVRVMEEIYNVQSERRADGTLVLSKKL